MKFRNLGLALLGLLISPGAWADGYGRGEWSGHMWGSGMIFGPLVMIGFIVLTVFFVVMIIRWMGGTSNAPSNLAVKSALEILNERYAKGEIDKDEYEERKLTLSS